MFARYDAAHSEGTFRLQGLGNMSFWTTISHYAVAIREFVAPSYRPERHYMRGPGPACARRRGGVSLQARVTFH
jgi:hypothetical protein